MKTLKVSGNFKEPESLSSSLAQSKNEVFDMKQRFENNQLQHRFRTSGNEHLINDVKGTR